MGTGPVLGSQTQVALAANGESWAAGMTGRTLATAHAFVATSEALRRVEQKEENSEMVGQIHRRRATHLGNMVDGPITFQGDYNALPFLIAFGMGTAGTPTETEAAARYTHRIQQHDSMIGVYATLGVNRNIDKTGSDGDETAFVYQAAKANGFVFTAEQGSVCKLTMPWLCRELTEDADPSAWTYRDNVNTGMQYMLLSQAVLRINAASGGALGSGDVLDLPVRVEISYAPNLGSDIYDDEGALDEPVMRRPPETRISVTWSRINQTLRTLLVDAFTNTTALKADLVFTGAALGAGTYAATWSFPHIYVDSDLDFVSENADLVGFPVEFHAQVATAAPTGMTGITNPVDLSVVNDVNADPLATS